MTRRLETRIERLEDSHRPQGWTRETWHKCDVLAEAYCEATGDVVTLLELEDIRRQVGEVYELPSLHLWPFGDGTDCEPDRVAYWRRRMAKRKEHLHGVGGTPRHAGFDEPGCPDCDQAVRGARAQSWEIPPADWPGWEVDGEALIRTLGRAVDWRLDFLADKVRSGERRLEEMWGDATDEIGQALSAEVARRVGGDDGNRHPATTAGH